MSKKFRRKLIQSSLVQSLISWVAYLYMELVYYTSRWEHHNRAVPESFWDAGKPMIVCFWHNRLLCMCRCWRKGVKATILISQHRDGRFISQTIHHYGVGTVTGSTSRGSSAALREMVEKIEQSYCVGITPDGPRGPRFQAAPGPVYLAKLTGIPIVNVSVATSKRKVLQSWDRFLVCLPFSRGAYVWGNPIHVPQDCSDADLELYRQKLEQDLIDVSNRSDQLCGQTPIPLDESRLNDMMSQRKAS
ncbi:MAG: DUF374 domain-containing protein [Alphaproteobacteria bacterium]|nr:MAG: DUF374 domain-containing protein [Alphaproteobacteria bacterium]